MGAGERAPDAALAERLRAAALEVAPRDPGDPALGGWYHAIDLGNGLSTEATYDLRSIADLHGLPESLAGKSALDVGTCDGFWAFELERRGAGPVVAADVARRSDFDMLPWVRDSMPRAPSMLMDERFWLAHAMRGSSVEHKVCSVYDLAPETVGSFDVVFCGSLLLHLMNPLQALVSIRSVTREMAVVASLHAPAVEEAGPGKPWLSFGHRGGDLRVKRNPQLGAEGIYWHLSTPALQELMEYAGFARTEPLDPVPMPPSDTRCAVVVGYPE